MFSFIVVDHNSSKNLEHCISSCLNQSFDGSCETVLITSNQEYKNEQITIFNSTNNGLLYDLKQALEKTNGNYISFIDSKDLVESNKLDILNKKIESFNQESVDNLLLCNDLKILIEKNKEYTGRSFFQSLGIPGYKTNSIHINQATNRFCFSSISGQTYSRSLLKQVLSLTPNTDWIDRDCFKAISFTAFLISESIEYVENPLNTYRLEECDDEYHFLDDKFRLKSLIDLSWPKLSYQLEKVVDLLNLSELERQERLSLLKRLEKDIRQSSAVRKFPEPRVSIVVTNYNYKQFLKASIESAINQSYENIELIIVDDVSNDGSQELIKEYCSNSKIQFIQNEKNVGQLGSMQNAYRQMTGDYFVFLDADDVLDKEFVSRHLYAHRFISMSAHTCSDIRFIDQENKLLHSNFYLSSGAWKQPYEYIGPFQEELEKWIFAPCSANLFRKTKLLDVFFDSLEKEDLDAFRICGDLPLLHYANVVGGTTRINECLMSHRLHQNNNFTHIHFPTPFVRTGDINRMPNYAHVSELLLRIFSNNYSEFRNFFTNAGMKRFFEWISGLSFKPNFSKELLDKAVNQIKAPKEVVSLLSVVNAESKK